MYDVRDIIKKIIEINELKKKVYKDIYENAGDIRTQMVAKVFINSVEKDIKNFNKMVKTVSNESVDFIDFGSYDLISKLISQFSVRISTHPQITSRTEFLDFAKELETSTYALLVDVQGRLVTNENIVDTLTYRTLSVMINDKKKNIDNMGKVLKI